MGQFVPGHWMLSKLLGLRFAALRLSPPALRISARGLASSPPGPDEKKRGTKRDSDGFLPIDQYEAMLKRKKELYDLVTKNFSQRNHSLIETAIASLLADFKGSMHALNVVLRARVLLNDAEGIKAVLAQINAAGLRPNSITYNHLVSYYRNIGRIEDAMEIVKRMESEGLSLTPSLYTTLINGWREKGDFRMVDSLVAQFRLSGLQPDLHLYNSMMRCSFECGRPEEARRLAEELVEAGVKPNHVTHKLFVRQLLKAGRMEEAEGLYRERLAECKEMESGDYGELVAEFHQARCSGLAMHIFKQTMERFGSCTPASLSAAITIYSTSRKDVKDSQEQIARLEKMCTRNQSTFSKTFEALLRHYIFLWKDTGDVQHKEHAKRIYDAARAANFGFSSRLEYLCERSLLNAAK